MQQADLPRVIPVLRREYLFQGLETEQLARVASFFEIVSYDRGEVVFSQGERADKFYIVLEGKVRVTRKDGRRTRLVNVLGPGDYFGEMALLFHFPRTASITTASPVSLLRLTREGFQTLLGDYPSIRLNLSATAESRRLARRLKFDWLGPEEVIYYIARKHVVFLILRLIGPFFVALAGLILAAAVLLPQPSWLGSLPVLVAFLIALLWAGWGYIDWSNDHYIVTSQRVVWQEKILALYDSRRETPLDAVLAVNVTTSQIGRILKYGNVDVRTFTGSIPMRRMEYPARFASFVEGYKKRVIAMSKEQERKQMEVDLEKALQKQIEPEVVIVPATRAPSEVAAKKPVQKKKPGFREWWRTFLKVRYEEGKVITYRKHWFLLAKKTVIPVILSSASLVVMVWMLFNQQVFFGCSLSILLLIWSGWLVYNYVDWRNDIYRLTPDQILDIEKKPLGRESKKTASLDAPDFRVEHTRDTLLNILLNFGTVKINIGQTTFDFVGVYNPDQVHQDVADYREAFMRRKREEDAKRERERMVNWLVTYHDRSEKLENPENTPET
ncbi:MAG: cyclic nucleotide-binding domain-containing protein [Chloroflexota bacterium]